MHNIDLFIQNYFYLTRTDYLVGIMHFITDLFGSTVYFVVIVFLACLLIYLLKGLKYSVFFFTTLFSGIVLVYIFKYFFDVSRPLNSAIEVSRQSFPSNHSATATVFFIILMYVFDEYLRPFWRVIFNTLCVLGILLISFSRIYLGVHWLSDVVFGVILGVAVSYIGIRIFSRF